MKKTSWTRREFRKFAGVTTLLVGASLGASSVIAQQTNAPVKAADDNSAAVDTSEYTDFNNWVELGVGGSIVTGDRAQYERQTGLPGNTAVGGVNSFHFEHPIGKKGLFSVDGRGIFDNHDYDLKLELQNPDIGYLTGGFRQFREYYDDTGGFFGRTGLSFAPPNTELTLDRGTAYVEGGLTLPDWPVLKVRYEHDYRSGAKDSTEWGTTTITPGAVQKRIAPAFRLINEKTDFIAVDATHTLWDTDLGAGLRYQWTRNTDSQNVLFFPGQPGLAAGTGYPHTLQQTDGDSDDMINVHGFTDSHINEAVEFTTGWSYTSMEDKIFGSRLDNPVPPTAGTAADTRYVNLVGTSDLEQYEMDSSFMFSPTENVFIVPAVRVEEEDMAGMSTFNSVTGVGTVGALTTSKDSQVGLNVAEGIDVRYTGCTNWTFYLRADWNQDRADLHLTQLPLAATPILDTNDWHQYTQKYCIGASWYPSTHLNFSAQYYHKIDDNIYENANPVPTNYPAYLQQQNFNVDDVNFRMTWRPCSSLTLVSLYDYSHSTVDTKGFNLIQLQSGENTTHQFGETVTWTPLNRLYVQLGANYVMDETDTPAEVNPATSGIIQQSRNDYWTVNSTIGYAIDDKTQVRGGYNYYRAADFSDNSAIGMPYGAGGEEHSATAGIERKITRQLSCKLQYNFTWYRDQLFGDNLDYTAHTIISSILYRF